LLKRALAVEVRLDRVGEFDDLARGDVGIGKRGGC
jgi:hypothetical protein